TGTLPYEAIRQVGDRPGLSPSPLHRLTPGTQYIMAAHVTGKVVEDEKLQLDQGVSDEELRASQEALDAEQPADQDAADEAKQKKAPVKFNAVVVADIDCLSDTFMQIRRISKDDEQMMIDWRFQNVTFVLNTLDSLAGDNRFLALRKRERDYRTLTQIENKTAEFREAAQQQQEDFQGVATEEIEAAQREFDKKLAEIDSNTELSDLEKRIRKEDVRRRERRKLDVKIKSLEDDRDKKIRQSERVLAAQIRSVQDWYKGAAVLVPPVLPIMLALPVFLHRRQQEKEGVSKHRLRYAKHEKTAA
ncbi:MAG: hypothetical protein KDA37_11415, partial [Planctomycetales bacterium]|nr:hypothetical protein [Planctomycetales bacterium]